MHHRLCCDQANKSDPKRTLLRPIPWTKILAMLTQDRDLLDRFRRGEREAMERVFQHYVGGITRYIRNGFTFSHGQERMRFAGIPGRYELHDIVAETFRAAFEEKARLGYSGLSSYQSYLRAIARNLVIDQLRSKTSKWISLDSENGTHSAAQHNQSTPQITPERAYERQELGELMEQFLTTLGPDERSFVKLRYQKHLSQRDTAEQMQRSRRWVRNTEVQVRKRLMKHMAKTGYLPSSL